VNTIGTYPLGTMVLLDTGETGIVHRRCSDPEAPDRPRIKITTDANGQAVPPFVVDLNDWDDERGAYRRSIVEAMAPTEFFSDVIDFATSCSRDDQRRKGMRKSSRTASSFAKPAPRKTAQNRKYRYPERWPTLSVHSLVAPVHRAPPVGTDA